ncbi:MAG TPA: hypothetical protein VD966_08000, partial [Pyrinomonadaceae bacterium]|nr:hypothetical protein [Pyrinomonadaceae bacterium]
TFLLCNLTILLPSTWREIRIFAGEQRIGHDSYEFMGTLYRNQMSLWLKGSPWYFYFVFMAVKIPLPVIAAFIVGLPLLFLKRLGDGRFFILFWLLYWFMPFTVLGGKFTRYFTMALPVVLITAAIGIHAMAQQLSSFVSRVFDSDLLQACTRSGVASLFILFTALASASATPHYRLYTNMLGGGSERAGSYFPHDEFYDASLRQAVAEVAARARPGARVGSETPGLVKHYAQLAGRSDLRSLSLSDQAALREFVEGDLIIVARGRRYFSNDALIARLQASSAPVADVTLGEVPSIRIYALNEASRAAISGPPER